MKPRASILRETALGFRPACLLVLAWLWFSQPAVLACRYNVRDLGFIEVASERYLLVQVTGDALEPAELARRQSGLEEQLVDTNLGAEVLTQADIAGHPSEAVLAPLVEENGPGWYLLSPDGFGVGVTSLTGESAGDAEPPARDRLLISSLAAEIARVGARSFGAILLIEGSDQDDNTKARAEIEAAIQEIRAGMGDLPKAVVAPPELVVLSGPRLAEEKVALWSLGWAAEVTEAPRAAVFYGTARWIGPLMEGPQITRANLSRLFSVIGADCECGMDLAWTRGTQLPLRWTEELHAVAAKSLGFDPASPMIRAEALRIISRYSRGELGDTYAARRNAASEPVSGGSAGSPGESADSSDGSKLGSAVVPPDSAANDATNPPTPTQNAGRRILLIVILCGLALLLLGTLVLLIVFHRVGRRAELAARKAHSHRGKG